MLRRIGTKERLLIAAGAAYIAVFALFVTFERPGLGIGHGFYIAITLTALATGPLPGALAGVLGAAAYAVAVVVNGKVQHDVPTLAMTIRLVTYTMIGTIVGHYAATTRRLLDELTLLAQRDRLTGLPNMRGFETAITRHIEAKTPFLLLVGDASEAAAVAQEREAFLLSLSERLSRFAPAGTELARIGDAGFAVLKTTRLPEEAPRLAVELERSLEMTFGWAVFPRDGENGLALMRAADERLYARKILRGESANVAELASARSRRPA